MLVVDPSCRPSIQQVQEHLASLGMNLDPADLNLELPATLPEIVESASNESLSNTVSDNSAVSSTSSGLMTSKMTSFMGRIRDTSKAVIQSVQHSMASRDLDLHLITERIAAMSYPAEGLESAMKNHIDDIAAILESRHANHYSVMNLTERTYNVGKFATGLVSQPGNFHPKIYKGAKIRKSPLFVAFQVGPQEDQHLSRQS